MGYANDAFQELANDITVTGAGVKAESVEKTIDFGAARNVGVGEPIAMGVNVDEIDGTDGDETYSAELQTSSESDFSSTESLGAITIARDKPATTYVHFLPKDNRVKRYLRLRLTLGGTTPSMKYSAYVGPASTFDSWTSYPVGYTVENVVGS